MTAVDLAPRVPAWVGTTAPAFGAAEIAALTHRIRETAFVVVDPETGRHGVAVGGELADADAARTLRVVAVLAPMYPEWLGDRGFTETHGVRFPYVAGEMANGIATTRMVIEMARNGYLGFFGAAGLGRERVAAAVDELVGVLGHDGAPFGCNLIHSPNEPALEAAVADLFIDRGVRKVSASAFMSLTPAIVRYAYRGVHVDPTGAVHRPNAVFAKISRPEVARHFINPAPSALLDHLVAHGELTPEEARLGAMLPVAEDLTVESDSGGHTDNRPLAPLFAAIQAVRDEITRATWVRAPHAARRGRRHRHAAGGCRGVRARRGVRPHRIGQPGVRRGGSGTAARSRCSRPRTSPTSRWLLRPTCSSSASSSRCSSAARCSPRGRRSCTSCTARTPRWTSIPQEATADLEQRVLGMSVGECWAATREFWAQRDPEQVVRAEANPRHRMALMFRSYLGLSSRWSIEGLEERRTDYQIWCGPAMGAFNAWTAGSFLAEPEHRTVVQVAHNLMEGAAVVTRAQQFRTFGVAVPPVAFNYRPRPLH